ncbi:MAG: methyltransferase domain-containing protein, partial [Vulcanimicrobiaceae bacterium]
MSPERITFEAPAPDYHAYDYSEHYLRYGLLRDICAGKRVLDVACGVGYGSYLLASWGAREVVGVDLSAEAITEARRLFGHDRITFVQGNVEELGRLVHGKFDLIVSFETIEHLKLPRLFLEHVSRLRTDAAVVAISAPNDAGVLRAEEPNRFHLHRFSFDEFRALSNNILGEASSWALAFPAQGTLLVDVVAFSGMTAAHSALGALDRQINCAADVLAAQNNCAPSAATSSFYIGVWGLVGINRAAISPMSVASFKEPWWLLSDLRAEVARLKSEAADLTATIDAERQNHAHAASDLRAEVARLKSEAADLTAMLDAERQNHAHAASDLRNTQIEMSKICDTLRRTRAELDAVQQSTIWRSTGILRRGIGRLSPRTRSAMRGMLRGAYWLVTPHLWRRRYTYFLAKKAITQNPTNHLGQEVAPIERKQPLPPWAIEIMREVGLEQDRTIY